MKPQGFLPPVKLPQESPPERDGQSRRGGNGTGWGLGHRDATCLRFPGPS